MPLQQQVVVGRVGRAHTCPPQRPTTRRAPCCHASRQPQEQAQAQPREVVVGIDLGTTNSAVAYMEGGRPRCIPNEAGDTVTPSVVAFLADGSTLVGKAARRQAALNPVNTYYSVKRLIGRPFTDPSVQEEAGRVAFQVQQAAAAGPRGMAAWCPQHAHAGLRHARVSMHTPDGTDITAVSRPCGTSHQPDCNSPCVCLRPVHPCTTLQTCARLGAPPTQPQQPNTGLPADPTTQPHQPSTGLPADTPTQPHQPTLTGLPGCRGLRDTALPACGNRGTVPRRGVLLCAGAAAGGCRGSNWWVGV